MKQNEKKCLRFFFQHTTASTRHTIFFRGSSCCCESKSQLMKEGRKEGSEKSVRVFFIMFKVIFNNVTYYSFRFPLVLKR